MTEYKYKLTNLGESSSKLGPCEVCSEHVTEVWHLQEERQYARPDGTTGWTQADCNNLFGHLKCLEGVRR